jgi:hypothetical protein
MKKINIQSFIGQNWRGFVCVVVLWLLTQRLAKRGSRLVIQSELVILCLRRRRMETGPRRDADRLMDFYSKTSTI